MLTSILENNYFTKKGNKSECECLGVFMLLHPSYHHRPSLCRIPVLKLLLAVKREMPLKTHMEHIMKNIVV